VHGGNVTNRVHGRMASPEKYAHLFRAASLDDVVTPRPMDLIIDSCVSQPKRLARDTVRTLLKKLALRLLGRDSLDTAKKYWISYTGRRV
jgi:hypothetical protein